MNSQHIDPPTSQPAVRLTSRLRLINTGQILTAVAAGAAIGVMLVLMMLSIPSQAAGAKTNTSRPATWRGAEHTASRIESCHPT